MLRVFQVLVLAIIVSNTVIAQVQVTRADGKEIIIFDDGTWQYAKTASSVDSVAGLEIDSLKEISTDFEELFYVRSVLLDRYFDVPGNHIRCKVSCSNIKGVVKLGFLWEVQVNEARKYFGAYDQGKKMVFTMLDGQEVELVMGDENNSRTWPTANYTAFSNYTVALTTKQIRVLLDQPVKKLEVGWKKRVSEEYEFLLSDYFMETLPTVLQ